MEQQLKNTYDLIYLMGCSLRQMPPDPQRVSGMDLEAIHQLSSSQSLDAMTCMALEASEVEFTGPLARLWIEKKNKVLRKTVLMDLERQAVCDYLEQIGAWYLPLKGSILQELYPRAGMRQMGDTDILYDSAFQAPLCRWFTDRGYTAVSVGESKHDIYEKPPVLNFEMHITLFAPGPEPWKTYCNHLHEHLLKLDGTRYGRCLSPENTYFYLLAHSYEHCTCSGSGLRILSDLYVFLRQYRSCLHWDSLQRLLEETELSSFENTVRSLADKIFEENFDPDSLSQPELTLLHYLADCGTYGNSDIGIKNHLTQVQEKKGKLGGRLSYIWSRLFPDEFFYQSMGQGAALYQTPWQKTRFLFQRFWRMLTRDRSRIFHELRLLFRK